MALDTRFSRIFSYYNLQTDELTQDRATSFEMGEEEPSRLSSRRTSSEVTLLGKEQHNVKLFTTTHRQSLWRQYILGFSCHFIIFLSYSTVVLLSTSLSRNAEQNCSILYSPANEALLWKVQEFHIKDGSVSPYSGYPRPELEEAWGNLLGNQNIRLSLEDLKKFNRDEDAVQLPDGSGYLGTLNIYHEIHCVKWLHTHIYQEYYFPNLDDAQREENRVHSEHCLTELRINAMCHGDVGMIIYKWENDTKRPKASSTAHQCIDYDLLVEWTNKRTIDMVKPGFLIHPTLGPVFSDDQSTRNAS